MNLHKDLNQFIDKKLASTRMNNIKAETEDFNRFNNDHLQKSEKLNEGNFNFKTQVITLEGVIFGAVILLLDKNLFSGWLYFALLFILISIGFGIWAQYLALSWAFWSQWFLYKNRLEQNWFIRELNKDGLVTIEKENYKKIFDKEPQVRSNKILKLLHLNADKVDLFFLKAFWLALLFLFLHFTFIFFK